MADERNANPDAGLAGDGGGLTILLADDEPEIRLLVGHVLRSHGHTVLEAADGVEALEVAGRHRGPIHLLLTDWNMPRLNGGGLIGRLRDGRPETAILVMSGNADCERSTAAAVLHKPFTSGDLLNTVGQVLGAGFSG